MSLIKRLFQSIILIAVLLAIAYWGISFYLQPGFNVSKNRLDVTQGEIDQVQTNLRLRLAKHALDALSTNSTLVEVPIKAQEVDPLIKAWLSTLVLPGEMQLVGSHFSIQDGLGKLDLALQLGSMPPLGITKLFQLDYEENVAILRIDGMRVGRFSLSEGAQSWLLNQVARQQNNGQSTSLLLIYPQTRELHFPLVLEDDQLSLSNMYFSDDHLKLNLNLNIKQLQGQLLQRLQGMLPSNLTGIPTLRELQQLLEQIQ